MRWVGGWPAAVLVGLLGVLAWPAGAHPPLVAADDAAVLPRGDCELEGGFERQRDRGLRGRAQALGLGWPLSGRLQVHAALARQSGASAARALSAGFVLGF